jgi:sulfonate transport system substrate-binding protein
MPIAGKLTGNIFLIRAYACRARARHHWGEIMRMTVKREGSSLASPTRRRVVAGAIAGSIATLSNLGAAAAQTPPTEIRIDWATYNPVSIVLKNQGLLEKEFAADGIKIRWVQSAGSNKALEFLNAGSIDFGSTAGAAALVGRINGNPIKSIYAYSRPEWTALVTRKGSGVKTVADLKGKRIAVTRGTDPHIFLVRALQDVGLTEKDVTLVLLQHADGKLALVRGDVDAWAGLDPMMATAEVEDGAELFFRNAEANTWGILNVREDFAKANPELVKRVLKVYEQAREWSRANGDKLKADFVGATKLSDAVVAKQIDERTDLRNSKIGDVQKQAILAAGLALQKAGVIKADVDVTGVVDDLLDKSFH